MSAVAPIPQHYIRWVDPETNRVVRMERISGASLEYTDEEQQEQAEEEQ